MSNLRHVNAIAGRLSLRQPQRTSLEILDRVTEIAPPSKRADLAAALDVIRSEYPGVTDFERDFVSLCFIVRWAALAGEGVVLNKDGSLQRSARFRGPDLDSAVPAELVAVAGRLNNAFRRLGSGWAIFVEAQRHGAVSYPASTFADSASALVDAERKADFEEAGAHFESSYFLTFLYLPPAEDAARAETWLYEGRDHAGVDAREVLRGFVDRTDRILNLIDAFMPECVWLDDAETLTYLHSTISTKRHRVASSAAPSIRRRIAASSRPAPSERTRKTSSQMSSQASRGRDASWCMGDRATKRSGSHNRRI